MTYTVVAEQMGVILMCVRGDNEMNICICIYMNKSLGHKW